jgi:hypothetical protein
VSALTETAPQGWWLSFVDRAEDAELGSAAVQLAVAIVIARDMEEAVRAAWTYGCNPGGEVAGMPLGFGAAVIRGVPKWRKLAFRLLQEPDITEAQMLIERTMAGAR